MRIVIGLILLSLSVAPANAQSTDTPDLLPGESVIRVQSTGKIERMPDLLGLTIHIRSQAPTAKEVAAENGMKLQRLMADLSALGIEEAWINAGDFEAAPIFAEKSDGRDDRSKVVAYAADQRLSIEIKDLSRFRAVLDRLSQEGYGDLTAGFRLDDKRGAELEAQRAAIASARSEAENMAAALGKRVGRLLLISNDQSGYRGWDDLSETIVVTGSRIQRIQLKPSPIAIESRVYSDWSLVDN